MEEKIKQSFFNGLFETKVQKVVWIIYIIFLISLLFGIPDIYKTRLEISELTLKKTVLEFILLTAVFLVLSKLLKRKTQ